MRFLLLAAALSFAACASPSREPAPDAATDDPPARTTAALPPQADTDLPVEQIELPEGFAIHVYAEDVPNARAMSLSPNGTLFVGSRQEGNVYAVVDEDGDYRADRVHTMAEGLNMPSGLAFRDGSLYVAAVSRILRFDAIEDHLADPPEPAVVTDDLPSERSHGWKYIAFGPDDKLYVPVGAPCNICDEPAPFASILRMDPDGRNQEVYARGIRNTVGFDWHPVTGNLWFTDNGRDNLGASMAEAGLLSASQATAVTDSLPPDELNRAPEAGLHFGYPYIHGGTISDPQFGEGHDPASYVKPVQNLGPHVAALGMEFYEGTLFPEDYQNQIFIAEHGSWNRSEKIGYRVMLVRLDGNGNATSYEPFATGWLQGDHAWGRPVDVETMPDGSLLVSDDHAGAIYRIVYAP